MPAWQDSLILLPRITRDSQKKWGITQACSQTHRYANPQSVCHGGILIFSLFQLCCLLASDHMVRLVRLSQNASVTLPFCVLKEMALKCKWTLVSSPLPPSASSQVCLWKVHILYRWHVWNSSGCWISCGGSGRWGGGLHGPAYGHLCSYPSESLKLWCRTCSSPSYPHSHCHTLFPPYIHNFTQAVYLCSILCCCCSKDTYIKLYL